MNGLRTCCGWRIRLRGVDRHGDHQLPSHRGEPQRLCPRICLSDQPVAHRAGRHAGGNYIKNALYDGQAVTEYPLEVGKQYILVYKTFAKFTPLTYELTVPSSVRVEGQITSIPLPVPDSQVDDAPITLATPRPRYLSHIVDQLYRQVSQ